MHILYIAAQAIHYTPMTKSHNLQRLIREYVFRLPYDIYVQEHRPNDRTRLQYIRTWFLVARQQTTWSRAEIFTDKSIIFSHGIVSTYYTSMLRSLSTT